MSEPFPLATYDGARPPAPSWFRKAIETPYRPRSVDVDGANICYQQWGSPDKPGLLLVHGDSAHSHWYDFIAPAFSDEYNVVAISLSGMGDSDWREAYSFDQYTAEQIAVMEDAGMFAHAVKPIIAAHSMGGLISIPTAHRCGNLLKGFALMDSSIHSPENIPERPVARMKDQLPLYSDQKSAMARFRLHPSQKCENHFILDHIARHSLKEVERDGVAGWTWKFDPSFWATMDWDDAEIWAMLKTETCKIAFVYGEQSALFTKKIKNDIASHVDVPMLPIKDAGHHVFVDKPLETIAKLRSIFSLWDE